MPVISSENDLMKTSNYILTALFLSISTLASKSEAAFTNAKCDYVLTGSGEIQISRQWDSEKRVCYLSIGPRNVVEMKYRDYLFDNSGQFMIFNSYGEGPSSSYTGSRTFYLFPIKFEYPDYSVEENGDVIVRMVSGHEMRISAANYTVVSFTPGSFKESVVSPKNKGGLEIMPTAGFWVDGGFKLGGTGFDNRNAKSKFASASSKEICTLANKEFLGYASDGNYGMKYQKEELKNFLAKKCPQLAL